MFGGEFDFESFADFMGYFANKVLAMIFQTKEWLEKVAKSFE